MRVWISIILFTAYWLVTLLFTLPDNYIKISLIKEERLFSTLFYQKWGFFAPPPKYNQKLIYIYLTNDNEPAHVYEALEKITSLKRNSAPFNSKPDLMEYIIGNSMSSVINYKIDLTDQFNAPLMDTLAAFTNDSIKKDYIEKMIEKQNTFQTLVNYGKEIHKSNNLSDQNADKFIFSIVKEDIVPFSIAMEKEIPIDSFEKPLEAIFVSDTIHIKQ